MTPEQEKHWYVSSPPSSDVPAVRARPLRGAPPGSLQFPGKRIREEQARPSTHTMAATNKSLAQTNKSHTRGKATKKQNRQ